MKIASYVYCRNKLVSHKKVSRVTLQTSFLCNQAYNIFNMYITSFISAYMLLIIDQFAERNPTFFAECKFEVISILIFVRL